MPSLSLSFDPCPLLPLGQDTGFRSPLPLNLPLESNYLAPRSPVSVLTAAGCMPAGLSEVRDYKAPINSSPIPTTARKGRGARGLLKGVG